MHDDILPPYPVQRTCFQKELLLSQDKAITTQEGKAPALRPGTSLVLLFGEVLHSFHTLVLSPVNVYM